MDRRFDRREISILIDAGTEQKDGGMSMSSGEELIGVVEYQFHRPLRRLGQIISDRHVDQRRLRAEIAADMHDVNLDSFLRHAEVFGHLVAQTPRTFV